MDTDSHMQQSTYEQDECGVQGEPPAEGNADLAPCLHIPNKQPTALKHRTTGRAREVRLAYKAIGQYIRPLLEAGCSRTIGVEVQTDETLQSQWGALPCAHVSDNIEMMHAIEQGKHRLILKVRTPDLLWPIGLPGSPVPLGLAGVTLLPDPLTPSQHSCLRLHLTVLDEGIGRGGQGAGSGGSISNSPAGTPQGADRGSPLPPPAAVGIATTGGAAAVSHIPAPAGGAPGIYGVHGTGLSGAVRPSLQQGYDVLSGTQQLLRGHHTHDSSLPLRKRPRKPQTMAPDGSPLRACSRLDTPSVTTPAQQQQLAGLNSPAPLSLSAAAATTAAAAAAAATTAAAAAAGSPAGPQKQENLPMSSAWGASANLRIPKRVVEVLLPNALVRQASSAGSKTFVPLVVVLEPDIFKRYESLPGLENFDVGVRMALGDGDLCVEVEREHPSTCNHRGGMRLSFEGVRMLPQATCVSLSCTLNHIWKLLTGSSANTPDNVRLYSYSFNACGPHGDAIEARITTNANRQLVPRLRPMGTPLGTIADLTAITTVGSAAGGLLGSSGGVAGAAGKTHGSLASVAAAAYGGGAGALPAAPGTPSTGSGSGSLMKQGSLSGQQARLVGRPPRSSLVAAGPTGPGSSAGPYDVPHFGVGAAAEAATQAYMRVMDEGLALKAAAVAAGIEAPYFQSQSGPGPAVIQVQGPGHGHGHGHGHGQRPGPTGLVAPRGVGMGASNHVGVGLGGGGGGGGGMGRMDVDGSRGALKTAGPSRFARPAQESGHDAYAHVYRSGPDQASRQHAGQYGAEAPDGRMESPKVQYNAASIQNAHAAPFSPARSVLSQSRLQSGAHSQLHGQAPSMLDAAAWQDAGQAHGGAVAVAVNGGGSSSEEEEAVAALGLMMREGRAVHH